MISRYAEYLRAVYSNSPVANSDKNFPPTLSRKFIKLALVKKEKESRAQAEKSINLTLQGDIDQILQDKELIKMDDILKVDDKVRLVVVEGAPGIGKSTLAWELCRQWPTLESLKRFSLVVLLRLQEEGVQSATDISDLFPCGDDPGLSSLVAQEVRAVNGEGVLFVFDGFDEFPSELREKSLVMDIISGSKYLPKATVLVTSRPSASAQLQERLQTGIGKHIEVVGFSEKESLEFARSVLGGTKLFDDFEAYLSANPVVKGMVYNPLNCAIVVGVYQDTYESNKPVPHTQTQLYTELIRGLLMRSEKYPLDSKLPDNLEDLKTHDSDLYQQLIEVGEYALYAKLRDQVIFKIIPKGCSDLGLYVKHTALYTGESSTTYSFYHITVQEYMIAFYISQLPADGLETLLKKGLSLYSTSMDIVWTFVAGLTKINDIRWDVVKMLFQHPTNELTRSLIDELYNLLSSFFCFIGFQSSCLPNNAFNISMKTLTMANHTSTETVNHFIPRCIYEAQAKREHCWRVFNEKKVKIYDYRVPNYDLYALGYSISVCSNTWNVHLRGIAREGLEMLGHGMKSVDYGGGSIDKLDLHWSQGIMNEGEHLLQIPHQILQHIKSLSLKGGDIDQRGFRNLAECIPYLHSLTSLDISANPGGDGSLVKLLKALREHGKLQTLLMDGIAIGMDDVKALTDLVQPSSPLKVSGYLLLLGPLAVDKCSGFLNLLQIPHQILQHIKIKSLSLKGCDIDQRGFENLAECIPYLHSLTSLDISDNPGGDGSLVKLLKALREHGKLQTLLMDGIAIGMDDVTALTDLVQPSSPLRVIGSLLLHGPLAVDNCSGFLNLLQIPHQILQHIKIKSLSLKGCDVQVGFKKLAECIPYLHSLTSLDISHNPGGDGSLVKLLKALREHGKLQTLLMHSITIGMDHVKALASLLQSSSNLKELAVGGSLLQPLDLEADVVKQLVKGVLAPSSLKTVTIRGCFYPLDYIEAISTTISSLTFECFMRLDSLNMPPRVNPRRVKGGTKLSHILRRNRSLKELKLHIPLDKDEIHDIIDSLKDNRSLERLWLSEEYHSQYFSESEKQAMDTRITLAHH